MRTSKKRAFTGFGMTLIFVLAFTIFFYVNFKTVVVRGNSMEPTFRDGQRLLMTKAYWLVGEIREKDIVVFEGESPEDIIIKRVYKGPGGVVDMWNVPDTWSLLKEFRVPAGHVYVLGDNRDRTQTFDSRDFGPVDYQQIKGKIVIRP